MNSNEYVFLKMVKEEVGQIEAAADIPAD